MSRDDPTPTTDHHALVRRLGFRATQSRPEDATVHDPGAVKPRPTPAHVDPGILDDSQLRAAPRLLRARNLLLLSLGLTLAPSDATAKSCADPSEALGLELRSVTRVDGGEPATDELARWATEGSATVGFKEGSFEHEEGTIRFESILADASLNLTVVLEEAS